MNSPHDECASIIGITSLQFTLPEKLYISIQVCQAIVYLHTSSPPLAHLDIKPANILVGFFMMTVYPVDVLL